MKYAISYVSTAAAKLSEEDIEGLLKQTTRNNNVKRITGILLYSNGNFFQVLEGEKSEVEILFKKIQQDNRHYDLIPIFKKNIEDPRFNTYENAFLSLDTAFNRNDLDFYTSQIEKLDPSIQKSVKYVIDSLS